VETQDPEALAEHGFNAYGEDDGKPMPTWEGVGPTVRARWVAAAKAIAARLTSVALALALAVLTQACLTMRPPPGEAPPSPARCQEWRAMGATWEWVDAYIRELVRAQEQAACVPPPPPPTPPAEPATPGEPPSPAAPAPAPQPTQEPVRAARAG
jgi:hypothetical protein